MNTPIVFISHSSHDSEMAKEICAFLENHGIKCWIAPRDIHPGAAYPTEITRGIKECDTFIVILTRMSVHSPHVNTETDIAFNANKQIIPFFAEKVDLGDSMSYYLARKQWILGYNNYSRSLRDLLDCIQNQPSHENQEDIEESEQVEETSETDAVKGERKYIPDWQQPYWKGFTKLQLITYAIIILLLFTIPVVGMVLLVALWIYPQKVYSIIYNYRKQFIIVTSTLVCLWIVFGAYLWFDGYKYEKRTVQNQYSQTEVSDVDYQSQGQLTDSVEVTGETEAYPLNNDIQSDKHKIINLETITELNNIPCNAIWEIETSQFGSSIRGHLTYQTDNTAKELACELRIHKRSLQGMIEDKDGANIGFFRGKIATESNGYMIIGQFIIDDRKYSYQEIPCKIEIKSSATINDILNKEIQSND